MKTFGFVSSTSDEDYYHSNKGFQPLNMQLRIASADKTPLTENFVAKTRDVYDMIKNGGKDSSGGGKIKDIVYNEERKMLTIIYDNGKEKTISLLGIDNFLTKATVENGLITFTLKDKSIVELDLTKDFYTKEQVNEIINNKDFIKWNKF